MSTTIKIRFGKSNTLCVRGLTRKETADLQYVIQRHLTCGLMFNNCDQCNAFCPDEMLSDNDDAGLGYICDTCKTTNRLR